MRPHWNTGRVPDIEQAVAQTFPHWRDVVADTLREAGFPEGNAHDLAITVISTLEGAEPTAQVAKSGTPPTVAGETRPGPSTPTRRESRPPCRESTTCSSPSLMVAGDDDPYCDPRTSASFTQPWHAQDHLVQGHGHGHINSGSGLGDWQAGLELLRGLVDC
ncbi:alpha/beta hydrolase [Streptomyces sp. NPDC015130]|uniref:LmrA/YxaF family transcription factor n=1 Tax=Streptomyces sp. NPDC015130 TaxID=3364940 RepID=UPI0036FD5F7B